MLFFVCWLCFATFQIPILTGLMIPCGTYPRWSSWKSSSVHVPFTGAHKHTRLHHHHHHSHQPTLLTLTLASYFSRIAEVDKMDCGSFWDAAHLEAFLQHCISLPHLLPWLYMVPLRGHNWCAVLSLYCQFGGLDRRRRRAGAWSLTC